MFYHLKELTFWGKDFTYMFRKMLIRKNDYFPTAYRKGDYGFVVLKDLILLQFVTWKFYFKGSKYLLKQWTIYFREYVWTGSLIPEIATTNQKKYFTYKNKNSGNSLLYSSCPVTLNGTQNASKYATFNQISYKKKRNFNTETKIYFSNHTVTHGIFLSNFLIVCVKLQHIVEDKCIQNF